MFGVADDYYTAVPDDPKPKEVKKLVREIAALCNRIVKTGGH